MNKPQEPALVECRQLLKFIDRSPTPFHAVFEIKRILESFGFTPLLEKDAWDLVSGGKYFVTRNDSCLSAFVVGSEPPELAGFKIIGAHTDSPTLKVRPNPVYEKNGYVQLGVEVYGGVLLATWTDRDLSLAGRVAIKGNGKPVSRLIRFQKPLLRIPQLAIHLNREINEKGLLLNKQKHMPPIMGLLHDSMDSENALKKLVAEELDCRAEDIVSMELSLFDTQPSSLGGMDSEFIFAPRLDNLASCHAAASALVESRHAAPATHVIAFYDNEEVGSVTAQGGGSPFLKDILERISANSPRPREALQRALARSLFISADMAHAVHPNYADKHDPSHLPLINRGPVIKTNAGQKYATDAVSSAQFELLCERAGVRAQHFSNRADLQCGSTIGPINAANLGIRTVDAGNPMLSMHSVREMAGSKDHGDLIRVFQEWFKG